MSVSVTRRLLGDCTRRMFKLVKCLGITGLTKSWVSGVAKDLDEHVQQLCAYRLDDAGPFTLAAADALVLRVREG